MWYWTERAKKEFTVIIITITIITIITIIVIIIIIVINIAVIIDLVTSKALMPLWRYGWLSEKCKFLIIY